MNTITAGMKVYSYCYGPMTVKSVDGNYITVSVDNPAGFSVDFAALCEKSKTDLKNIKFLAAAFGHWYFASAADVQARKENNSFPEANNQSGTPRAMVRDDRYLHADFGGKTTSGLTEKGGKTSSGLTEKNTGVTSGLTEKA